MSSRACYLVTPADTRLPAIRVVAEDLIDVGRQAAAFFTRHHRLVRGVQYDAEIGDEQGFIRQSGLPKPLTFDICKEG